jgi:glycine/D-amino acid oxidase-like deaminating enzyme
MKIAIVGAGFAGLALAWHLGSEHKITVFDEVGIGGGASGVSTGLLHPYPGRHGKLSWRGEEGLKASRALLEAASGKKRVFADTGIQRFQTPYHPGGWMAEGITVFSRLYLEELWKVCKGEFVQRKVNALEELDEYEAILLTCGASISKFANLPVKTNIGQALLCRWNEPVAYSMLGLGHISPTEHRDFCQVGSTYEHGERPDRQKALDLLEKVAVFYPPAREFKIEEIRWGIRVAPKVGVRPIVEKVGPNVWVFTGLGSRGLLYHALLASELDLSK